VAEHQEQILLVVVTGKRFVGMVVRLVVELVVVLVVAVVLVAFVAVLGQQHLKVYNL